MIQKDNFFILTGGPGAGKTTLLLELQRRGYICIPEAARIIIKEQIDCNGNALPWGNIRKYAKLMLEHSIKDYMDHLSNMNIHFFDRGIPDTYGYMKLTGLPIQAELKKAVCNYKYNPKVFILPPWQEIYQNDTERKQDWKEAINTYHTMKSIYTELGYELIEIPLLSVYERASFVITEIDN